MGIRAALVCVAVGLTSSACTPRARGGPVVAPEPPIATTQAEPTPAPPDDEPPPTVSADPEPPDSPAAQPPGPVVWTEGARARLFASPEDAPAVTRGGVTVELRDKQYLAGNEKTLHAFRAAIRDLGGGYVGVGSDQAYLLIGWMRPEVAWLIDYDADVVAIHEVYRIFLAHADTPQAMIDLWRRESKLDAVALIEADAPAEDRKHLRQLYLGHRGWIHRRLTGLAKRLDRADVPSWLTDQETYAFVRQIVHEGRVRPMVVNLLERQGMAGIAQTARELGVTVRVLYLSNAEEYWPRYEQSFRENVAALPMDERSVVLRTLLIWEVNNDYRYNLQPLENFAEWLDRPFIRNVYDIVHARPEPDPTIINYFETRSDPDDSPRAPRSTEDHRVGTRPLAEPRPRAQSSPGGASPLVAGLCTSAAASSSEAAQRKPK